MELAELVELAELAELVELAEVFHWSTLPINSILGLIVNNFNIRDYILFFLCVL